MTRALITYPDNVLLVFDGDCGFCTTCVNWLRENLPVMPEAIPYQWADLDSMGMSAQEASERVWLITPERHYGGHLAISALLRHQPSFKWRFAGWMLVAPVFTWVAAAGYALVARFRHRLPGGTPACRVDGRSR